MASDERKTARPPPGISRISSPNLEIEPTFVIQLYYPNNIALAHAVAAHIKKRSEDTLEVPTNASITTTHRRAKAYGGLKPAITEYEKLPDNIRGVIAHALVVGIDESCQPDDIVADVKRYFVDQSVVIIHVTSDGWVETLAYIPLQPVGMFTGYEFSKLDLLLEKAAQEQRPTRKYAKP